MFQNAINFSSCSVLPTNFIDCNFSTHKIDLRELYYLHNKSVNTVWARNLCLQDFVPKKPFCTLGTGPGDGDRPCERGGKDFRRWFSFWGLGAGRANEAAERGEKRTTGRPRTKLGWRGRTEKEKRCLTALDHLLLNPKSGGICVVRDAHNAAQIDNGKERLRIQLSQQPFSPIVSVEDIDVLQQSVDE